MKTNKRRRAIDVEFNPLIHTYRCAMCDECRADYGAFIWFKFDKTPRIQGRVCLKCMRFARAIIKGAI